MKIILKIIGKILSAITHLYLCRSLFNYIYENVLPYKLIRYLVKYVHLPNKNFIWNIRINNGKVVRTKVYKNNPKTAEFALSYKWHNPALNFSEKLLNNFYGKSIVWFDMGANLGLRSLLFLSENKPVVFFEPNKQLNQFNIERCKLNNFGNYQFIEKGVSDKQEEISFYIDKTSYNSSIYSDNIDAADIDRVETIKVDTLDNLVNEIEVADDFSNACIKIDVEGNELNVLKGSKKFIEKYHPTMIIEVNDKGDHFQEFLSTVSNYQYQVFAIGLFGSKKYFKKIDANTGHLRSNDFLIVNNSSLTEEILKFSVQ